MRFIKIKKILSTSLALGMLFNYSLPTFASTLSDDTRYETFEGSNITINDILEPDEVDVEIEGNTLVNVLNYDSPKIGEYWTYTNNCGYMSLADKTDSYKGIVYNFNKDIELNKEYTMFINVTKNTMKLYGNEGNGIAKISFLDDSLEGHIMYIQPSQTGVIKYVFRPTKIQNYNTYISILPRAYDGEFEYKDFMIIEGNHIDKDISFFEGIKSVGELEKNKIEVKLKNKNLFNINNVHPEDSIGINDDVSINIADNSLLISKMDSHSNFVGLRIKCENNKEYTIGFKGGINKAGKSHEIYVYKDKPWGEVIAILENSSSTETKYKSFTTTSDEIFIGCYLSKNTEVDEVLEYKDIFVYEGDGSEYIQYQENLLQYTLSEPLRGLPNGVKDRIVKINNQWYIERNTGYKILDGSENWYYPNEFVDATLEYTQYYTDYFNNKNINVHKRVYSDKLITDVSGYNKNNEAIMSGWASKNIHIRISKNRLKNDNAEEFKEWLSKNSITMIYQLSEPIYEPINIYSSINLFEDTTYILTNSTIPANLRVTVDRVVNRAKEYSELSKENPTIENISLARMWVNRMRESILKDKFQDNVDSITEIADMTLDRKSVTSNVDVYIKSENMLGVSLNTNTITFEDFSGVEDMVKDNAIDITINSSLPYSLNAYIPTEILNSDKSNYMDLEILSIKESTESNYQTFNNINEKLVLKDNNLAGNNLLHSISFKLKGGIAHEKDVYKTTIKFEAEQK